MIYTYRCMDCKRRRFYLSRPITAEIKDGKHEGAKCPSCGSGNVRKLINQFYVTYRGEGFTKAVQEKK